MFVRDHASDTPPWDARSGPAASGAMAPERAGSERASRGGVSLARLHANSEGPCRGTSLLGRMRRRVGAAASMAAASDRSEPAGQKKTHKEWERKQGRAPAWQNKALTQ